MATIYLVACASSKRDRPAPAQELYVSALFAKSAELARRRSDRWFILSAEHGLVRPEQVLAPYDRTLKLMPRPQRRAWAERVLHDLRREVQPGDQVVFLAGKAYRADMTLPLARWGVSVEVPMEEMRIGQQLQWLTRQCAER